MTLVMIDTHIVIWLYTNRIDKISNKAQKSIESNQLLISPIVLLELQYLFETSKILAHSEEIYEDLCSRIGLKVEQNESWYRVAKEALKLSWTRDPFDRLIVAHTKLFRCCLITKDKLIRSNFEQTIW
jgi:PIN domain nuclease of toxin-antitoxin system